MKFEGSRFQRDNPDYQEEVLIKQDIIICRCEEITLSEIIQAIKEGAKDISGVKRRTRAGMGLCQGRTCEKLIQQILEKELKKFPKNIKMGTDRPPIKPVTFGELGGKDQ